MLIAVLHWNRIKSQSCPAWKELRDVVNCDLMSRMLKAVVERIGEVEQPIAMPFPSWCQLVVASWSVKVATAWLYSEGMAWDFQAILISFQRSFSTMGQFLYTLWGMPFGPGAKAALFTTRLISDHLGGAVSNLKTGSVRRGTCLCEVGCSQGHIIESWCALQGPAGWQLSVIFLLQ